MKRIWISSLAAASVLAFAAPAMAATVYPIGPVNIRSGPGTEFTVVGALRDKAAMLGHEGNWMKVRTPGGTVGYVA
ncbi:MAG TPA: SH3 domain-containing protein, partial [Symbiobacteriaceae bacterium]|nr:SH3 domain-containing protein [Symbiobacteriaceae bacterium]